MSLIELNSGELNVLISSLQLLNCSDEKNIAKANQISLPSLYNKLTSVMEQLNHNE